MGNKRQHTINRRFSFTEEDNDNVLKLQQYMEDRLKLSKPSTASALRHAVKIALMHYESKPV